jgi:hypothetical protein
VSKLNSKLFVLPPLQALRDYMGEDDVFHRLILQDPKFRKTANLVSGIGGAARGYNTIDDVVTTTTDGRDLNGIWDLFRAAVDLRNRQRQTLIDFLTASVTAPIVDVPQFGAVDAFEIASEFGIPKSMRASATTFAMGFPFEWYDARGAFTWKFLLEATAQQVEATGNAILEADNVLVFTEVMKALFNNVTRVATIKKTAYNVYPFYNNDGTVPPAYKSNTFLGTHNHYFQSAGGTVTSPDLDNLQNSLTEHGYSAANGAELILMVNVAQGDTIRQFKSVANGGTAKYDFIPAQGQPRLLFPVNFINDPNTTRPAAQIRGMTVIGAYGEFTVVQEEFMPAGYMVAFATGGSESLQNPIGIREHANPAVRGLRLVKGREPDYPLQDSYFQRGFGAAVRQRGSGSVMRIGGAYTPPAAFS